MFKIIKGGKLFSPDPQGNKDILIAGGLIANIAPNISPFPEYGDVEVIDVTGLYIVPGLIDQHIHLIGGGGEAGFSSRTPEITLSRIIMGGITTVVGCLGTDGTTRHMTSLLAKARALEEEGITAFIYTGSYEIPVKTITGSIRNDIILIKEVLGAGEIAISDHRSSQPTKEEIKKLAAEARLGGMLSGKAGVLHLHVGDGKTGLRFLFEIVEEKEIPIRQFTPTHINRNPDLLEEGIRFAKLGGFIDMTSSINSGTGPSKAIKASRAIRYCLDQDVPIENITMSSDGNGSLPAFDERGNLIGLKMAEPLSLYRELKNLIIEEGIPLQDAIKTVTLNPARSLKLYPKKGTIKVGSDADILVLDEKLDIVYLFAKGKTLIKEGKLIVKGTFEE
ncbi:MAG: beta-aspartyl-peptidase [Synergistetes bacterium]|nr:beta-aspartyl-peptidase [Synergistota bacterium]